MAPDDDHTDADTFPSHRDPLDYPASSRRIQELSTLALETSYWQEMEERPTKFEGKVLIDLFCIDLRYLRHHF